MNNNIDMSTFESMKVTELRLWLRERDPEMMKGRSRATRDEMLGLIKMYYNRHGFTAEAVVENPEPARPYSGQDMVGDPGPWEATAPTQGGLDGDRADILVGVDYGDLERRVVSAAAKPSGDILVQKVEEDPPGLLVGSARPHGDVVRSILHKAGLRDLVKEFKDTYSTHNRRARRRAESLMKRILPRLKPWGVSLNEAVQVV